jgi:hypothetical protein
MFSTIRKHQTWLLAAIVTLTIASFVILGPTTSRMANPFKHGGDANLGAIGGVPITLLQYQAARKDVILDDYFKNRQWPTASDSPEIQAATYKQLFMLSKARELGVDITTEAVAKAASVMLRGATLDDIADRLKVASLDEADFLHFIRSQLSIEQLRVTAGTCGKLVTPQEAETMYRIENREVAASLIYFNCSNYMSKVEATPDALSKFYSNQMANYRLPDQVQVDFVKFDVTNYMADAETSVTNLDKLVDSNDSNLGTNFFQGTKNRADSKAAIRKEILREVALKKAQMAATIFGNVVFDQPHNIANFESFASKSNLTVQITKPFGRQYGPEEVNLHVPPSFTTEAFGLTSDEPYSPTIRAEDGVYLMALRERFPSRTPALSEIQSRVKDDFIYLSSLQLAQEDANKFYAKVSLMLALGSKLDDVASGAGVTPIPITPFSLATRSIAPDIESKIAFSSLKQVAFNVASNKCSSVLTPQSGVHDGVALVYVEKFVPVDESKLKTELPQFLSYMRQVRENEAFSGWINTQVRADSDFMAAFQQVVQGTQMRNSGRPKS